MAAFDDDLTPRTSLAQRVSGWEHRDGTVLLQLEPNAELAISVVESGAIRLTLRPAGSPEPRPLTHPEPALAPLAVTTTDATIHLASERHARYGPDPEDVSIQVGIDPFALAVVDASGRQVLRLADEAPLAWNDDSASATFTLDAGERLFGLDAQPGSLDRVGTTRSLDPLGASPDAPAGRFLLSGKGYGLFVHTQARLTADFGTRSPTAYTLTAGEPTLDLLLFPASWPRTALSACANLLGRAPLPPARAFGLLASPGLNASPEVADALAERLRAEAIPFDMLVPRGVPQPPPLPRKRERGPGGGGHTSERGAGRRGLTDSADSMRAALQASLSFGIAGPGRWRHDTSPPPADSPALYARWVQARLLAPFAHAPMPAGAAPWEVGEPALSTLRAYARLRYRLLPYLLHCAHESAQLGLPMLRPLVLEFSWDETAAPIDDQYLLGRDLLVAPIFSEEAGAVARRVYLPRYANWYDWWTGKPLEGGQWIEEVCPPERLPLYVRAGTAIPLADPRPAIADQPIDVTRLVLFAPLDGAIGSSIELAEGDLLGVEHERGPERSRIYIEGLPPTVRDIEIVGLPPTTQMGDAASPRVRIVEGDGSLPGLGGDWESVTVALDVGAYTTGLELRW